MRQWEIEATLPVSGCVLRYLVAPTDSVFKVHKRLLLDDAIWRKARIRVAQERDPAAEFWKRLVLTKALELKKDVESVRVRPD